jgi:hypothetical protein
VKVDTDVLSIHRGLLLFVRGSVVRTPSLDRLGFLTGSGGPAPSSHQFGIAARPIGVDDVVAGKRARLRTRAFVGHHVHDGGRPGGAVTFEAVPTAGALCDRRRIASRGRYKRREKMAIDGVVGDDDYVPTGEPFCHVVEGGGDAIGECGQSLDVGCRVDRAVALAEGRLGEPAQSR